MEYFGIFFLAFSWFASLDFSFSMSSTQIGEEMSQNSFIKQYLEKQQELLRQRLEREAREAAELEGKPRLSLLTRSSSFLFLSPSRWACLTRQFLENIRLRLLICFGSLWSQVSYCLPIVQEGDNLTVLLEEDSCQQEEL